MRSSSVAIPGSGEKGPATQHLMKFIENHKFITRKDKHTRKLASILTRQFLGEGKSKGESAESRGKSAESVELQNKQIELFKKTSAVDKMIEKASIAEMRQCKMSSEGMDSSRMTSK